MALTLANVQTSDTFQTWFTRTNEIIGLAIEQGSLANLANTVIYSGAVANKYGSNTNPIVYTVTVGSKSSNHPFNGIGSGSAYYVNGIESPALQLRGINPGYPSYYKFDQSNGTNSSHPVKFYLDKDKTIPYTRGVTVNGAAGSTGAATWITVDKDTPNIIYYQCQNHAYMGYYAQSDSANFIHASLTANTITANTLSGTFSGDGSGLTGVGITTATDTVASRTLRIPFTGFSSGLMTSANVNPTFTFNPATGTVAANNFVGDGSQLTGTETTVAVNGGANSSLSVLFTGITAGQLTSANTHTALLYNPSIGTLFATDFDSTSDERLKKNIKPIEGALEKVSKLVGVEFDWINTDKKSIGVIAQQVEEVVPELVHTNSKGYKSVSYGNLAALLIEAIKELSENSKTGNDQ